VIAHPSFRCLVTLGNPHLYTDFRIAGLCASMQTCVVARLHSALITFPPGDRTSFIGGVCVSWCYQCVISGNLNRATAFAFCSPHLCKRARIFELPDEHVQRYKRRLFQHDREQQVTSSRCRGSGTPSMSYTFVQDRRQWPSVTGSCTKVVTHLSCSSSRHTQTSSLCWLTVR
jgi:hypothetical protein